MVDHLVADRRSTSSAPPSSASEVKAAVPPATTNAVEPSKQAANAPVPHLNDAIAGTLVQNFKLLADETRLRILFFLMHRKELNVRSLCELLEQSQPAVSHHLALLRNAEFIDSRRDGKHNFYHLLPAKFQQLIDTLSNVSPGTPSQVLFADYAKLPPES